MKILKNYATYPNQSSDFDVSAHDWPSEYYADDLKFSLFLDSKFWGLKMINVSTFFWPRSIFKNDVFVIPSRNIFEIFAKRLRKIESDYL